MWLWFTSKVRPPRSTSLFYATRFWLLAGFLLLLTLVLIARMAYLTIFERSFLQQQGNVRAIRVVSIPADRGMITDRNGQPLAISVPVDSVWINPQDFPNTAQNRRQLGAILNIPPQTIVKLLQKNKKRSFVYLKRNVAVAITQKVQALALAGVYFEQSYQRYYPQANMTAHVIGFTNVDNRGQEGLELKYNKWLQGVLGKERVIKDRLGNTVAILDTIRAAKPGKSLRLSIDQRIQYVAYRVLQQTVQKFKAESGSVVVMNPRNGEVLAMVNLPSYDPNHRRGREVSRYRNRAVTDVFEPGSVMKAFSIASALDSGKYTPTSKVDTGNGQFKVSGHIIHDDSDNGVIDVTQVLQVSSNIGAAKLTLSLPPQQLISLLERMGFGQVTNSGFPGEAAGYVPDDRANWRPIDLATLAFGYGLTVTTLQLAHAYSIIANNGLSCPTSLLLRSKVPHCSRVMTQKIATEMRTMLHTVVIPPGTGTRARTKNYTVAGKTGTAYIAQAGGKGYEGDKNYTSSFVGMAPLSMPRLVIAVVIRKPQGQHFGALVAAPAFSKIMSSSLRILNVPPDKGSAALATASSPATKLVPPTATPLKKTNSP